MKRRYQTEKNGRGWVIKDRERNRVLGQMSDGVAEDFILDTRDEGRQVVDELESMREFDKLRKVFAQI